MRDKVLLDEVFLVEDEVSVCVLVESLLFVTLTLLLFFFRRFILYMLIMLGIIFISIFVLELL